MDTIKDLKYVNENLKFILGLLTEKQKQKKENVETQNQKIQKKEVVEVLDKYKERSLNKYKLTIYDIGNYLDKIDKEYEMKKIHPKALPMDLTCYEDTIKFKCYDNEILDNMIKNAMIDIEKYTKDLKFINDYQQYLRDFEVKECVNHQIMLNEKLLELCEDVKFLNSLKK